MTCRVCNGTIRRTELLPGLFVWGHEANPRQNHHYPNPTSPAARNGGAPSTGQPEAPDSAGLRATSHGASTATQRSIGAEVVSRVPPDRAPSAPMGAARRS